MRLALIQFNPTVGAIDANAARILQRATAAAEAGADLIALPELALTGYPPRDLLLQEGFCDAARTAARELARGLPAGPLVLIGAPWNADPTDPGADDRRRPTNALLAMRGGQIEAIHAKRLLPNYDIFDERRYFATGDRAVVVEHLGLRVGLAVCEDLWKGVDVDPEHLSMEAYAGKADPVAELAAAGAQLIVNASASPFVVGKQDRQAAIAADHARRHRVAIASVNQLGANDDLVFDGAASLVVPAGPDARVVAAATPFAESDLLIELPADPAAWDGLAPAPGRPRDEMASLFDALTLGVRDYVRKTGFSRTIVGVSGGIDSAVTAAIAAAALGPENLLGVAMPSRYSSDHSVDDALALCDAIGCRRVTVPIEQPHAAFESILGHAFAELGLALEHDLTEENVQSRVRGVILMALSNKSGALVLTTGNKSELAVGYCTLYGDMNGALAVLADVSKIDVYGLARWINDHHAERGFAGPPIPESTIDKPPSAELRPDQLDSDSLPPYDTIDEVVERFVERRQSPGRIVRETGFDPAVVARLCRMIDVNEYKRKQMPIGLKVSSIAFGRGRRRAIAQDYRPGVGPPA